MKIDHDYKVKLFEEKGFVRKRCEKCGQYFWTLDGDRKTCGDSPCVGVLFISYWVSNEGVHITGTVSTGLSILI